MFRQQECTLLRLRDETNPLILLLKDAAQSGKDRLFGLKVDEQIRIICRVGIFAKGFKIVAHVSRMRSGASFLSVPGKKGIAMASRL